MGESELHHLILYRNQHSNHKHVPLNYRHKFVDNSNRPSVEDRGSIPGRTQFCLCYNIQTASKPPPIPPSRTRPWGSFLQLVQRLGMCGHVPPLPPSKVYVVFLNTTDKLIVCLQIGVRQIQQTTWILPMRKKYSSSSFNVQQVRPRIRLRSSDNGGPSSVHNPTGDARLTVNSVFSPRNIHACINNPEWRASSLDRRLAGIVSIRSAVSIYYQCTSLTWTS